MSHSSEAEQEQLAKIWTKYIKNRLVDTDKGVHAPPALLATCDSVVHKYLNEVFNNGGKFDGESLSFFAAEMVLFGQYALRHGVDLGTFEQCKCATITDHDINLLLTQK